MVALSIVLILAVLWNVLPHVLLWVCPGVPAAHKIAASRSMLAASVDGIRMLPADLAAPLVVPLALLKTPWTADKLPSWAWMWDNDVSINGDGREEQDGTLMSYSDPRYKGDAYYAEGYHPRSFYARWVWLGLRNRASALAEYLSIPITEAMDVDRQHWGDIATDRDHEGWFLQRAGDVYQLYIVKTLSSTNLCYRFNFGYKVRNVEKKALPVAIAFSLLRQKKPVT